MVTLRQQKSIWIKQLEEAGVFAPAFELCEIVQHAVGFSRTCQLAKADEPLTSEQLAAIGALLTERYSGRPLQYILGKWEFYGLEFYVGEGVLIPRADTETLVEVSLELFANFRLDRLNIADLCSGSGCIAVALAQHLLCAQITAVELSAEACGYLLRNIALNNAQNVMPMQADVLTCSDLFSDLDLIVSNPPYIRTSELIGLQREVRREPALALDGTEDGLYFYREISSRYKNSLKEGGWLVFEAGDDQSGDIRDILRQNGYGSIAVHKDLAGFKRVVCGQHTLIEASPQTLYER